MDTWIGFIPASSDSTANVSLNMCGWHRLGVPSASLIAASLNSLP